jgi:BirA family biotin operon repressor/biotin-[acetyl-CoA-carboxylase] ligase
LKKPIDVCTLIEPVKERLTMMIHSDDRSYADQHLSSQGRWVRYDQRSAGAGLHRLKKRLFPGRTVYTKECDTYGRWRHAFIVKSAPSSHFDHLVDLSQENIDLPDGTICLAGSGRQFHGQSQRPWSALEGNIHLALYIAPHRVIKRFHTGFPILAAVSLIEALDAISPLKDRAVIKWVNDILIDGAKIAGFLVHTQSMENTVLSAILGIGLNVEKTPRIKTDPFVPKVSSLMHFLPERSGSDKEAILLHLLRSLDKNYKLLLDGQYKKLLHRYRERSIVIGQHVKVMSDNPRKKSHLIASGLVIDIGENLELLLEGHPEPVKSGRLILA